MNIMRFIRLLHKRITDGPFSRSEKWTVIDHFVTDKHVSLADLDREALDIKHFTGRFVKASNLLPTKVIFEVLRRWEKTKRYREEGNRGNVKKKRAWRIKWVPSPHRVFLSPQALAQHQPLKSTWPLSVRIMGRSETEQPTDRICVFSSR